MIWPNNKDFAFTIVDDTDNSTIENIRAVYQFLSSKNIKTTKTVWVYPSRDSFTGQTLQDQNYLDFLLELKKDGFEIQLHNVGSGSFERAEIIEGFEIFKDKIGEYPSMHINHADNPDTIYWGYNRHGSILKTIVKLLKGNTRKFYGEDEKSKHYWGDLSKKHIKYIRNRVFNGINTLKYDPRMPYRDKQKPLSNFWFSSSDGHTVEEFNNLISKSNIDKLKAEKGLCIVYTHFSCGFQNTNGEINKTFKKNIDYLAKQNAWFAPTSEILDYLQNQKTKQSIPSFYDNILDFKWVIERIIKKIKYGR